ncbi:ammonium transporter Rh type B-like [Oratosquilla oratoria]|uniref:ammonium transporter Rh type B-like n=1 Tax=Oratosquilla oratoria TaxID=337810 RepID=UPI003F7719EE
MALLNFCHGPQVRRGSSTVRYGRDADGGHDIHNVDRYLGGLDPKDNTARTYYSQLQDTYTFLFIGMGLRLALLREWGYGALGFNLLMGCLSLQWSLLCHGFFYSKNWDIMISYSPGRIHQYLDRSEPWSPPGHGVPSSTPRPHALSSPSSDSESLHRLRHLQGRRPRRECYSACFRRLLRTLVQPDHYEWKRNSYTSSSINTNDSTLVYDCVIMGKTEGDDRHRVIINSVLSTTAGAIAAFVTSSILHPRNLYDMAHIQGALIGSGVAITAVADLMLQPYGAILMGSTAGALSVTGLYLGVPWLRARAGIHDVMGVGVVHGTAGMLGSAAGAVLASFASITRQYGYSMYEIYPARSPPAKSQELLQIQQYLVVEGGSGRSSLAQAGFQLAALFTSLAIAVCGGAVTGCFLRLPLCDRLSREDLYRDEKYWQLPSRQDNYNKNNNNGERTTLFTMARYEHYDEVNSGK